MQLFIVIDDIADIGFLFLVANDSNTIWVNIIISSKMTLSLFKNYPDHLHMMKIIHGIFIMKSLGALWNM